MRKQVERWGAELYQEDVEFVNVKSRPFVIRSSDREVHAVVLFLLFVLYRLFLEFEFSFITRWCFVSYLLGDQWSVLA